ncbi:hypothetical protein AB1Y20_011227 [Prymnesium parvum]|uniref:Uncharacterized protein n=1 Tax=Prymnesium parvum TaxID=97485 RepID=A0AB34IPY1_PRYPA
MVAEPWLAYLHAPPPAPPEQPEADAPPWTRDMDDMLRITLRQRAFDFEQASAQISRYVMRVRTSGGMLPDEVNELLYTPAECRCRWAALDRQFLDAHAAFEAAERAWTEPPPPEPPPPERPRAAWASGSAEALSGAEEGEEATDSDDEDSSAAGGIVNVEALRAQMLRKAGGGGARGVPVETAAPPRSMESVERDFYAAVGLGGSDGAPAAAAASRGTPASHSFPMFKPPAPPPPKGDGGPARAHEAAGAAQRSEAELAALQKLAETDEEAARIVEPLTGLKARVESLQESPHLSCRGLRRSPLILPVAAR